MKLKTLLVAAFLGICGTAFAQSQNGIAIPNGAYLTGDTKLACEALLCLSSGTRPGACAPSIAHYYGIHHRKLSDTIRARKNFLRLCPTANQTPQMAALVEALGDAEGRCTAEALNSSLRTHDVQYYDLEPLRSIKDGMPGYCRAIQEHEYTDYATSTLPRYVGEVKMGGYWVESQNYNAELQRYTVWKEQYQIEIEKARRRWLESDRGS